MTGQARDPKVLADQSEVRLRVVEGREERARLPPRCSVAGLARLLELTFVRIHVAGTALSKGDSGVARLAIRPSCVAFLAGDVLMQAGQRKMCLGMIEAVCVDLRALPVRGRMALDAVCAEAALVLVLVARDAVGRKTEPGMTEILARQKAAPRLNYMRRLMAGATTHAHVLPIQRIAGLRVVESLGRRIPVQQGEVLAVVVRVTLYAGRACWPGLRIRGVQSLMLLKLRSDLLVALDTSKRWRAR